MVPWRATDEGNVTPALLEWYGRLADGQPGVLVVEATGIRDIPSGPLLRAGHARFLPGLSELARLVKERSAGQTRVFIQLIDFLRVRRRPEREAYLLRFLDIQDRHREALQIQDEVELRQALLALPEEDLEQVLSAREWEDLRYGARERVTDTHLESVRRLPETLPPLFASAAGHARQAGFDGVELHFAHAYTMASFLSLTNDREDGYGGTPEGRVRLPLEVLAAVREKVGPGFPVGCRLLGDEVVTGGSRIEDVCVYATHFARAGMDFLSVSKGGKFDDAAQPKVGEAVYPYTGPSGHECMPTVYIDGAKPFGRNLGLPKRIRAAVHAAGFDTPVVGAGGMGTFADGEGALLDGSCDMVAAARQSLADPDWWRKMRAGHGEQVRRCVYTNYCEALDQRHKEVTCQLWDRDLDAETDVPMSRDGRRRLSAPAWVPDPPE
jgi:2,4-dienoyl-CoA reductase-like NADH-dependent reductase (Old Yellow Enzyme family)